MSEQLRYGWTTGACATAATTAAYTALLTGEFPDPVEVLLPKGKRPSFALATERRGDGEASAGVGTVTLPGLPLEVGEPAINPAPRRMMREAVERVAAEHVDGGDVLVEISVPHGEQIARHTWNPRLGIRGGISILGTTGVVVPFSCSAWIDSIRRGVDVARALGHRHVAGAVGSTSERVVAELHALPDTALLDMGDFAGAVLKYVKRHPVPRLTIAGGFAKISKLAAGFLDLHSKRSQVDTGLLARLAEEAGHGAVAADIAEANTALHALEIAAADGLALGELVAERARQAAVGVLGDAPVEVDIVVLDRGGEIVGRAPRP
jgi:cobalt-precorrin-5B (C1)-methyltransferase